MKTLLLLLLTSSVVSASPVTFGQSWDGDPPGTFGDLTGDFMPSAGLPNFAAGTWMITVDGGYSAWYAQDVIGVEGDSQCSASNQPCVLGKPDPGQHFTQLEVYLDRPWRLWATTPSFTHQTSNGAQFAFTQTGPNAWTWGLEDISLTTGSDRDFQDVIGRIWLVSGPTPDPRDVTPVPEPTSFLLMGSGLTLTARRIRRIKAEVPSTR